VETIAECSAEQNGPVLRPKRRWDAAATKARLLRAAEEEFAANGFAGTCVDDIARGAAANVQAIYRYFGGKAGLHQAAFDDLYGEIARRVQEAVEAAPPAGLSPRERFTAIAGIFFDTVWEHPVFARFALWALAEGMRPDALGKGAGLELLSGMVTCSLDISIADGALKPSTSPKSFLRLLLAICLGQYGLVNVQDDQASPLGPDSPELRARLRDELGTALLAVFGA
jgi:AcrR family transcriptional regulator